MRSRVYEAVERPSVCPSAYLSHHSTAAAACGRFASEHRAGRRYRSTNIDLLCYCLAEFSHSYHLPVSTASEMTYTVSGGALNSTQTQTSSQCSYVAQLTSLAVGLHRDLPNRGR